MKLTKLVMALATFATITLSSSAYIATNEVTSAVLVDKAKHSLDLTTNGLHNISVREAFTIDKSEAAQINFLRCSFARPEFRFSWFCHQMRSDGKMTKQSYVALKADQEKYFKENVIKSVSYEAQKWILRAEQMRIGTAMHNLSKKQVTNINEFNDKFEDASIIAKDVQLFNEKYKALNDVANNEIQEKATGVNGDLNSLENVGYGMMKAALQLHRINSPVGSGAAHSQKKVYSSDLDSIMKETEANESKASGMNGEASLLNNVETGGRELMTAGNQIIFRKMVSDSPLSIDPITEISNISISDVIERFDENNSPSSIKDFEPQAKEILRNIDKGFLAGIGLFAADTHENKHAGVGTKEHTTNEKIIAGISIIVCLSILVILIIALVREIKKLEKKLLNGDFNEKKDGEQHDE